MTWLMLWSHDSSHHIIIRVMQPSGDHHWSHDVMLWSHDSSHHIIIRVMQPSGDHHCCYHHWCNLRVIITSFNLGSFRTHFRLKLGSTAQIRPQLSPPESCITSSLLVFNRRRSINLRQPYGWASFITSFVLFHQIITI